MDKKQNFKKLYYDASHPARFGVHDRLCRVLRKLNRQDITSTESKYFLFMQDCYTLHMAPGTLFLRNWIFAPRPLELFQAGLCDMQSLSDLNDGYNYLLTVIDAFSKTAYVIKSKNGRGSGWGHLNQFLKNS